MYEHSIDNMCLFRGPFLTGIKQTGFIGQILVWTLRISIVTTLPHLPVLVPVTLLSQCLAHLFMCQTLI